MSTCNLKLLFKDEILEVQDFDQVKYQIEQVKKELKGEKLIRLQSKKERPR